MPAGSEFGGPVQVANAGVLACRVTSAGAIAQGTVYRAAQGVFTLEGANIHEAYLVLRGQELVGFYLPVEQAFSPLKDPVMLQFDSR